MINFVEGYTASTLSNDIIKVNRQSETDSLLDKYTFSNALALSVKLGTLCTSVRACADRLFG